MDVQIQYRVDQLLLEQGEYLPLEFLLAEGRLMYSDYESWREGDVAVLDEQLFGDSEQAKRDLAQAAAYARALKLDSEPLVYAPWGGGAALKFSRDDILNRLFHQGYRKPADAPQLDLFMDSAGTSLANTVALALGRRDTAEAVESLQKLYRTEPGHPRLGGLERLVEAALSLDLPLADPERALADLRDDILPLAEDLLGKDSRQFLVPLWRRLDDVLAGQPFDPLRPELHRSYTAAAMLDWQRVIVAVEAEPEWRSQPLLLQRHAAACERLQRSIDALLDRFALCWRFPQQAELSATGAPLDLIRAWDRFLELEPELEVSAFPAWLLILRPAMTQWLSPPDDDAPEDYRLVFALQRASATPGAAPGSDAVRLRGELKKLNSELFHHFIANLPR